MKIGLIDVDGHNFPNIPLMKLSAWHKSMGNQVDWYNPLLSGHIDKVYMSKVFNFTPDYMYFIDADTVIKGGSGYAIETNNGKEIYRNDLDKPLMYDIEHTYPDYALYPDLTKDTAYGFLSRGCPRGCDFCHVKNKEGGQSVKVANLSEFWRGQKNIVLCDPNLLACPDWEDLLGQLIDSKAKVNINQGLDIRLVTEEKATLIKKIRVDRVHFAWDRYKDKDLVVTNLKMFKEITKWHYSKMEVLILTNFDTSIEQDLERVYTIRDLGYDPYIMIYNKANTNSKMKIRKLQRWTNNKFIFRSTDKFEEYIS